MHNVKLFFPTEMECQKSYIFFFFFYNWIENKWFIKLIFTLSPIRKVSGYVLAMYWTSSIFSRSTAMWRAHLLIEFFPIANSFPPPLFLFNNSFTFATLPVLISWCTSSRCVYEKIIFFRYINLRYFLKI